jgi:hypothetical protein
MGRHFKLRHYQNFLGPTLLAVLITLWRELAEG